MSKKVGKLLLLTAVVGAAAYGTYAYLQKKEQPANEPIDDDADDDFDDFSEDLDEDLTTSKERSYVPLNLNFEAIATEAFQKAKEVISDSVQQVKETVKSVADSQGYHTSFTDLTAAAKGAADDVVADVEAVTEDLAESVADTAEEIKDGAAEVVENVEAAAEGVAEATASLADEANETVEEFFDDEEV